MLVKISVGPSRLCVKHTLTWGFGRISMHAAANKLLNSVMPAVLRTIAQNTQSFGFVGGGWKSENWQKNTDIISLPKIFFSLGPVRPKLWQFIMSWMLPNYGGLKVLRARTFFDCLLLDQRDLTFICLSPAKKQKKKMLKIFGVPSSNFCPAIVPVTHWLLCLHWANGQRIC